MSLPGPRAPRHPLLPAAAAFLAILVWGATPAATALATAAIPAPLVGMLRTLIAAVVLTCIAATQSWRLPSDRTGWLALAVAGLIGFVAYPVILTLGIARTSTAHAALILAGTPIFTGLLGFLISRRWPRPVWWVGAVVALCGQAVLMSARVSGDPSRAGGIAGDLIVLLSAVCVSISYVAGAALAKRIGTWAATGWAVILGGLAVLPFAAPAARALDWIDLPSASLAAVLFLALVTTIVGYAAWFWALSVGDAASIVPLQFGQPVVSLVLAAALLGEQLGAATFAATALILLGVVICRRS